MGVLGWEGGHPEVVGGTPGWGGGTQGGGTQRYLPALLTARGGDGGRGGTGGSPLPQLPFNYFFPTRFYILINSFSPLFLIFFPIFGFLGFVVFFFF